jgi:hypothetical protein
MPNRTASLSRSVWLYTLLAAMSIVLGRIVNNETKLLDFGSHLLLRAHQSIGCFRHCSAACQMVVEVEKVSLRPFSVGIGV